MLLKKELHIISDIIFDEYDFIETTKEIHPHVTAIHLRVKAWSAHKLFTLIERLAGKGIPLQKIYVNDRVDVAVASGAGGVQLTYRSLPVKHVKEFFQGIRIGKTVHTLEEAIQAESEGADYVMFRDVFPSDLTQEAQSQVLEKLEAFCAALTIPVVAHGGITVKNAESVLPFADGIAVQSANWQSTERPAMIKAFYDLLNRWEP